MMKKTYQILGDLMIRKGFFTILVLLMIFSCNNNSKKIDEVLKLAKTNRSELEKVINHYKEIGDKEKLKATYFLIENMEGKYSLEGKVLDKYFKIYEDILKAYGSGIKNLEVLDSIAHVKLDSLEVYYGPVKDENLEDKPDLANIKADFLIENIDLAIEVWRTKPWAKHVNFKQFCEYILPYRVYSEPLQNWRSYLKNEYDIFGDSLKNEADPKEITKKVCAYIYRDWKHLDQFDRCAYFPGVKDIDHYKAGICEHQYLLVTAVLRSLGIPCSIDFTPHWKSWPGKHSWMALLDTTGQMVAFNPGDPAYDKFYQHVVPIGKGATTKVFRKTYSIQKSSLPEMNVEDNYIPDEFDNRFIYDVTKEYTYPQVNIELKVDKKLDGKIIYLTVFNYGLNREPAAWTKVKNNKADFGPLGFPAVYVPVYYQNNKEYPAGDLVIIDEKRNYVRPTAIDTAKKQTVKLTRKYPLNGAMWAFCRDLIGGKFQAADNPGFKKAIDLYTIRDTIDYFFEIPVTDPTAYRYVRFIAAKNGQLNLSEMEFYSQNEKLAEFKLSGKIIGKGKIIKGSYQNVFDCNSSTSFSSDSGSWIGLDLGKPRKISKIRYLPRNDMNHIEIGDIYELFYWYNNAWQSLGRKIADKNYIEYHNVPKEALLLLKDISKGKEERIFMYKNNNPVWW